MIFNFYGLVYLIASIICLLVIKNYLKRKKMDQELAYGLILSLIVGLIIGARIFFCFYYEFDYFTKNFVEIFYIWQGGLSFHGGLIGLLIGGYIFCKKNKIDFLEIGDVLSIPIALFLAIGRIANFMNSELYGTITKVPWCVKFENANGCRHPVQVYNSIINFFIFLNLLYLSRKKMKKGTLLLLFIFLTSFLRFFIDFFRQYQNYYFGLGEGQYLNILFSIVSLLIILIRTKK